MIFDSLGLGELGVIFVLIVILVEPKHVGKIMKSLGRFRRKISQIQSDVKAQIDAVVVAEELKEIQDKRHSDKAGMRRWATEQIQSLPGSVKEAASEAIVDALAAWDVYQNAKVVSCFAGTLEEIDTTPVLRKILADGKTLLVPYLSKPEAAKQDPAPEAEDAAAAAVAKLETSSLVMGMAAITDPDRDLTEGAYRILEPREELREGAPPAPDLVLVPGLCFDAKGGRIGKGKGFYDKYLAAPPGRGAARAGLCFDVQITQKNLILESHDQRMDVVLSEKRFLRASQP